MVIIKKLYYDARPTKFQEWVRHLHDSHKSAQNCFLGYVLCQHCYICAPTCTLYWHNKQILKLCSYGYMTAWSLVFFSLCFPFFLSSVTRCCSLLYLSVRYHKSPALEGPSLLEQWVMTSAHPSAITYKWRVCNSLLSYQSFSACCVEVTTDTEKPHVARLPDSSVLCRQCCRLRGVCVCVCVWLYAAWRSGWVRGEACAEAQSDHKTAVSRNYSLLPTL